MDRNRVAVEAAKEEKRKNRINVYVYMYIKQNERIYTRWVHANNII